MKEVKKFIFQKAKKFLALFISVTPCKECYRGRLAFTFAAGSLGTLLISELPFYLNWSFFLVGLVGAFIFTARKNDWWR